VLEHHQQQQQAAWYVRLSCSLSLQIQREREREGASWRSVGRVLVLAADKHQRATAAAAAAGKAPDRGRLGPEGRGAHDGRDEA